jgi:hypothetical protein
MYTRTEDTLITLTNRNQLSRLGKEIRLGIKRQKGNGRVSKKKKEGRREGATHQRETKGFSVAMGASERHGPLGVEYTYAFKRDIRGVGGRCDVAFKLK